MTNQHPITPPSDLVEEWYDSIPGSSTDWKQQLSAQAARWGADQELEACCEWMEASSWVDDDLPDELRMVRRPKPPTLKEQALSELNLTADPDGAELSRTQVELIRRALEALPND